LEAAEGVLGEARRILMAKNKRPKSTSLGGYGIVNPYGDMWTVEVFPTEKQARDHLERFWASGEHGTTDLSRFKIVHAKQTTSYVDDVQ
jgi:hypothetical protein